MTGAARLQALLDEGVAAGVFPCAAAVVLHRGNRVFEGAAGGATPRTIFDLASLTKILATTAACLALWRDGALRPEMPVAQMSGSRKRSCNPRTIVLTTAGPS